MIETSGFFSLYTVLQQLYLWVNKFRNLYPFCRYVGPQKSVHFILYKIAYKVSGNLFYNPLNIQKSSFVPFSFMITKKSWLPYHQACFHQDQKSGNQVKISYFSTLFGITQKVIITEKWTKKPKNLVLSYKYTGKKNFKIRWKQVSYGQPIHLSACPWPEERGAILQCCSMQIVLVILLGQQFWENADLTLFRLNSSKKVFRDPLWFFTSGIGI